MSMSILVAYATKAGSTQEVAEAIAETLRECGFTVDIQPAANVKTLDGYQAVVLGAPLYIMRWQKEAHQLLSRQRKALENLPIAIFALGPWNNKEEELQSARDQLQKELARYPWLKPATTQVFVGKFDPTKLGFPFNLIGPLKKMPAQDDRDWNAIRSWAGSLSGTLPINP